MWSQKPIDSIISDNIKQISLIKDLLCTEYNLEKTLMSCSYLLLVYNSTKLFYLNSLICTLSLS